MTDVEIAATGTDAAVLRPVGRLNLVTAPALRQAVADQIALGRARLIVDLADVEFMDSSGLGALIGALKTTREAGGDLRIAAPGEQVAMVLALSNVDRILKPYPSVDAAAAED